MRQLGFLPVVALVPFLLVGWVPGGGKNLQHFPKDTDLDTLKSEMDTIARSLGVECDKCHVMKPARDFSVDTDEKKSARGMLDMLSKMQDKVLTADFIGRKRPIAGTCYMCHQGKWKVELKPEKADDEKRFNEMAESPRKKRAVDGMKKLVEALNKDYFTWKDAPKATCWMCHRGQDKVHTRLPRKEGAEGDDKKPDEKKPDEKKPDEKKPEDKKPEEPKPEGKKPEDDKKGPF